MAAEPSPDAFVDLNFTRNHARDTTVEAALCELVANGFDANASAGVKAPPDVALDGSATVFIRDVGAGIARKSFVVGRGTEAVAHNTLGQFGLGLKDAIATLMRNGARVTIESALGSAIFDERMGSNGVVTIHMNFDTSSRLGKGTVVTVSRLPSAADVVAKVKLSFRLLGPLADAQPLATLATRVGTVTVYDATPLPPSETYIFVNGAKKEWGERLHFAYDVCVNADGAELYGRDHEIKPKSNRVKLRTAIAESICTLTETLTGNQLEPLRKAAPLSAKYELDKWLGLRELFYPAPLPAVAAPPVVGGAASPSTTLATAPSAVDVSVLPFTAVILFDFENAHNAASTLQEVAAAFPTVRLLVFARSDTNVDAVKQEANVIIFPSSTTSPEAADTILSFHAGSLHATTATSSRFVIVCGQEKRYPELIAALTDPTTRGPRQASIVRFDNTAPLLQTFWDEVVAAVVG